MGKAEVGLDLLAGPYKRDDITARDQLTRISRRFAPQLAHENDQAAIIDTLTNEINRVLNELVDHLEVLCKTTRCSLREAWIAQPSR